jgi:hypothetical protein
VRRLARTTLLVSLCALVLASTAVASPLLMVRGSMSRMQDQTGQRSDGKITFWGWGSGWTWGLRFHKALPGLGRVPIVSLGTSKPGRGEVITPGAIARGKGDGYLRAIAHGIADYHDGPIYIRPMAEMNGHWNAYCAFNQDGSSRGASNSTAAFRKAFARVYLIVHGGPAGALNAKLRRLGLPPARTGELATNPRSRVRVVWNPQGYGSPDVGGNSAAAYYPGDAYVDVVANDLYNINHSAAWEANDQLYAAHPNKPYAIAEWANWGFDDPAFVARMAAFVKDHRRVELVAYYNGRPSSPWDIARQPRSRAAYRQLIVPLGR